MMFLVGRQMTLITLGISLLFPILWSIIGSQAYPVTTARKSDLFYIYDTGQWQTIANTSRTVRDPREIMDHYLNGGAGSLINSTTGMYHTDQYQLFLLIFSRALKDPRRTLDPSKATTFIVPYDIASDAAFYKNCAKSEGVCYDFRRCPLAPTVNELLKASPWHLRNNGKDHLLIIGMNYAMNHHIGKPKCKQLLLDACFNCTKIAIDDYSYLQATNAGILEKGDNWHATPFPSDFHWSRDVKKPFPWENRNRRFLSSYVGSTQSYYGPARRLRQSIAYYCNMHNEICVHQSYGVNGTRHSYKVEGHNPLEISASSVFCFQPIGDLMTRKGLFDSILQGCIPVTFDALTASSMYTWHWEEEFWSDVSIQYPFDPTAKRYFDVVLALQDLMINNASLILRKQELIRSRVFELQYSREGKYEYARNAPDVYESNILHYDNTSFNEVTNKIHPNWPLYKDGTPMRDAYEIMMDHILGWHSGVEPDVRNGTVPECWNGYLDVLENKCKPHPEVKKEIKSS